MKKLGKIIKFIRIDIILILILDLKREVNVKWKKCKMDRVENKQCLGEKKL